jgi:ribosomal protein S8
MKYKIIKECYKLRDVGKEIEFSNKELAQANLLEKMGYIEKVEDVKKTNSRKKKTTKNDDETSTD